MKIHNNAQLNISKKIRFSDALLGAESGKAGGNIVQRRADVTVAESVQVGGSADTTIVCIGSGLEETVTENSSKPIMNSFFNDNKPNAPGLKKFKNK